MKTLKESFLTNAHLFIMMATLVITCAVVSGRAVYSAPDDVHAAYISYGYDSVSAQYLLAMGTDEHITDTQGPQPKQMNKDSGRSKILVGLQYAAEAGQEVFDPYGQRQMPSKDSRQKQAYSRVLIAMQYAAESTQDVFDPYGLQAAPLTIAREKTVIKAPVS